MYVNDPKYSTPEEKKTRSVEVRVVVFPFPHATERKAAVIDATMIRGALVDTNMSNTQLLQAYLSRAVGAWIALQDSDTLTDAKYDMDWLVRTLGDGQFSTSSVNSRLSQLQNCILSTGIDRFSLEVFLSSNINHCWDWNDWLHLSPLEPKK